ncbi:MAG TPA: hypothetical protein VLS96_05920 [Nodosilinea sp.]|nr:hypothetical protein [Nodosilinea sp.]
MRSARQQIDILKAPPLSSPLRSTYGYFSAFNFFFPWLRRQNIRWLQDKYSYRLALNPEAKFHFIGHSNGTYSLGESLKRVPAMQFGRIYLAGSVLPRDYPWQERFDLDQVGQLRNDRSCWDWPVGLLCSGLRGIGMTDICWPWPGCGSGGWARALPGIAWGFGSSWRCQPRFCTPPTPWPKRARAPSRRPPPI